MSEIKQEYESQGQGALFVSLILGCMIVVYIYMISTKLAELGLEIPPETVVFFAILIVMYLMVSYSCYKSSIKKEMH